MSLANKYDFISHDALSDIIDNLVDNTESWTEHNCLFNVMKEVFSITEKHEKGTIQLTYDNLCKAKQCLIDNEIESSEAGTVLEALVAILLDIDIDNIIPKEELNNFYG